MNKKDNIISRPITFFQRKKNINGPLRVECQISGRYLEFHEQSSVFQDGEFISIDIMSERIEDNKEPKKLCGLVITREDLLVALSHVTPTDN